MRTKEEIISKNFRYIIDTGLLICKNNADLEPLNQFLKRNNREVRKQALEEVFAYLKAQYNYDNGIFMTKDMVEVEENKWLKKEVEK